MSYMCGYHLSQQMPHGSSSSQDLIIEFPKFSQKSPESLYGENFSCDFSLVSMALFRFVIVFRTFPLILLDLLLFSFDFLGFP